MMSNLPQKPKCTQKLLLIFLLALTSPVCLFAQAAQTAANSRHDQPAQPSSTSPRADAAPPAAEDQLRKAQIEEDTKKLYQLSAELRAEVGKTYKDSLSVAVLRKAEELEKLAH